MKPLAAFLCAGVMITCTAVSVAFAGKPFFDDFDGNSPVTWSRYAPPYDGGTVEVADGNLTLTPSSDGPPPYPTAPNYFEAYATAQGQQYHDVDIHTQFRALEPGESFAGIGILDNLYSDRTQGTAIWGFLHPSGDLRLLYEQDRSLQGLGSVPAGLSSLEDEIQLRLVIDGEFVRLTGWVGLDEPGPQLSTRLPAPLREQDHEGQVTLFTGGTDPLVPVAFRFVDVVPEPSSAGLGLLGAVGLLAIRRRRLGCSVVGICVQRRSTTL